jgi:uncharacterized protein (TIGR02996 family)
MIREFPDNDAPRLVYADWLDEQGDPRGEFIRVQCELARMAQDDARRAGVLSREKSCSPRIGAIGRTWPSLPGCGIASAIAATPKDTIFANSSRKAFVLNVTTIGLQKMILAAQS